MTSLSDVSVAPRVAGDDEGVGLDDLALATRNHGLPLELLRHDLTLLGAHYLLTHYDIPYVDPRTFRLELGGAVDHPVSLTLDELKARPTVTVPVTLECAGNGRARLHPRPVSQPWLHEAVGTMAWTGTPLGPLLRAAGLGRQRRRPAAPARRAAAAGGARVVRHGLGQVAPADRGGPHRVRRLPDACLPAAAEPRGERRGADPDRAEGADRPARLPGLHVADPGAPRRPARARGPGLVRPRPGHRGGGGGDRGGFANTALHRIDVVVPG
jgi:hypothetical protein